MFHIYEGNVLFATPLYGFSSFFSERVVVQLCISILTYADVLKI